MVKAFSLWQGNISVEQTVDMGVLADARAALTRVACKSTFARRGRFLTGLGCQLKSVSFADVFGLVFRCQLGTGFLGVSL